MEIRKMRFVEQIVFLVMMAAVWLALSNFVYEDETSMYVDDALVLWSVYEGIHDDVIDRTVGGITPYGEYKYEEPIYFDADNGCVGEPVPSE